MQFVIKMSKKIIIYLFSQNGHFILKIVKETWDGIKLIATV